MDRFQFSLLGLSAEEERMRLVSTSASDSTSLTRLVRECAPRRSLLVWCILKLGTHVWLAVRRGSLALPRVSCCPVSSGGPQPALSRRRQLASSCPLQCSVAMFSTLGQAYMAAERPLTRR